ncbi:MAG: YitT family protein [Oscillospiraceae bacterium]
MKSLKRKINMKAVVVTFMHQLIGTTLFAMGISMFAAPNNIVPGGLSSLALMVNYTFGLPIGVVSLVLNIPLVILSFKFLGKSSTLKTFVNILLTSFMLDVVFKNFYIYEGDVLLACLYGAVISGAGLGIVFRKDSTTGGTDIISRLVQLKYPQASLGNIILFCNAITLVLAVFVYRNLEAALYGLIFSFVSGKMIDLFIYGSDNGKMILVITTKHNEISAAIFSRLGRGSTLIDSKGAYSNEQREIVLCAVRKSQFYNLKSIVNEIDPMAFLIVSDASEILGEGFKPLKMKKQN